LVGAYVCVYLPSQSYVVTRQEATSVEWHGVALGPQWEEVVALRTTKGSEAEVPASGRLGLCVVDDQYVAQFEFVKLNDVRESRHFG
jgi:hypothetical protein